MRCMPSIFKNDSCMGTFNFPIQHSLGADTECCVKAAYDLFKAIKSGHKFLQVDVLYALNHDHHLLEAIDALR